METRKCIEGRNESKRVAFKNETYRSPRGTRIREGAVSVTGYGPRGGTIVVRRGNIIERWHRVCSAA